MTYELWLVYSFDEEIDEYLMEPEFEVSVEHELQPMDIIPYGDIRFIVWTVDEENKKVICFEKEEWF